jgi:hypothetical protein
MVGHCADEKRFGAVGVEPANQTLWASAHGMASRLIQMQTFPWVPRKELIARVINNAVEILVSRLG